MKNLYDQAVYEEIGTRIQLLSNQTERKWGKMNVAQMLAHCCEAFKVPLSNRPMKRMLLGYLIGGLLKSKLYNESPWKRNLPTAPNFIIKEQRDFETEKKRLLELIEAFYTRGPQNSGLYPHPLFGKLNSEQWGKSMYKHMDHHLQQFGV